MRFSGKGNKKVNKMVYDIHKDKPVIVTEIKIITPMSDELVEGIRSGEKGDPMTVLTQLLNMFNDDVEDKLMETFTSDIAEMYSHADGPILG